MENNPENSFGFELLYQVSRQQLSKKEDVLVLFAHWYFLRNGFKCLGLGDSKTIGPDEKSSEILPPGWSESINYSLRYIKDGKLFILMGIKSESNLLLNLLRIDDQKVYNVELSIDVVQKMEGPLEVLIPNNSAIGKILHNQLIVPIQAGGVNSNEVSTQTSEESRPGVSRNIDNDPLRDSRTSGESSDDQRSRIPHRPFGDLDPLGGAGGGMLFDPFNPRGQPRPSFPGLGVPGRLPHGAIPPGARFDPFGPDEIDPMRPRRPPPDNDYFGRPGWGDIA